MTNQIIEPSDEEDEEEFVEDGDAAQSDDGEHNSQLTLGYKGDRAYVIRGNKIGVFSHSGSNLNYHATLNQVTNKKGKAFAPSHVSLCSAFISGTSLIRRILDDVA